MIEKEKKPRINYLIPIIILLVSITLTFVFLPKKEPQVTNPNSFQFDDEVAFVGRPNEIYNLEIEVGDVQNRMNEHGISGDQRYTLHLTLFDQNNNELQYSIFLYYDQLNTTEELIQPDLGTRLEDGKLVYWIDVINEGDYIVIVSTENTSTEEFTLYKAGSSTLPIESYSVIWFGFMGSVISLGILIEMLVHPTSNVEKPVEEIYTYRRKKRSKKISKDFNNPTSFHNIN